MTAPRRSPHPRPSARAAQDFVWPPPAEELDSLEMLPVGPPPEGGTAEGGTSEEERLSREQLERDRERRRARARALAAGTSQGVAPTGAADAILQRIKLDRYQEEEEPVWALQRVPARRAPPQPASATAHQMRPSGPPASRLALQGGLIVLALIAGWMIGARNSGESDLDVTPSEAGTLAQNEAAPSGPPTANANTTPPTGYPASAPGAATSGALARGGASGTNPDVSTPLDASRTGSPQDSDARRSREEAAGQQARFADRRAARGDAARETDAPARGNAREAGTRADDSLAGGTAGNAASTAGSATGGAAGATSGAGNAASPASSTAGSAVEATNAAAANTGETAPPVTTPGVMTSGLTSLAASATTRTAPAPPGVAPAVPDLSATTAAKATANGVEALSTIPPVSSPARRAEADGSVGFSRDLANVRETLANYKRAFDTLNARAATGVIPSLDVEALGRAFSGLRSQALSFDRCTFTIGDSTATAVCQGSSTIVPRVGNAAPKTERLRWTFKLRRTTGPWQIESVDTDRHPEMPRASASCRFPPCRGTGIW